MVRQMTVQDLDHAVHRTKGFAALVELVRKELRRRRRYPRAVDLHVEVHWAKWRRRLGCWVCSLEDVWPDPEDPAPLFTWKLFPEGRVAFQAGDGAWAEADVKHRFDGPSAEEAFEALAGLTVAPAADEVVKALAARKGAK